MDELTHAAWQAVAAGMLGLEAYRFVIESRESKAFRLAVPARRMPLNVDPLGGGSDS